MQLLGDRSQVSKLRWNWCVHMNACMYILNRHMHIVWTKEGRKKIKRGKRRVHQMPRVEDEGNPAPTVQEGRGHGRAAASRERLKGDGASAGPRGDDATEGLRRVGRRRSS